jgi:hypothetical protein
MKALQPGGMLEQKLKGLTGVNSASNGVEGW